MKIIERTTQFKKDFKRYRNNPSKVARLLEVVRLLENGQPLPEKMRLHMLTGNYQDCMECHIDGDYLLIWMDVSKDIIRLLRLGSHSALF